MKPDEAKPKRTSRASTPRKPATGRGSAPKAAAKATPARARKGGKVVLLAGGNPQIAKADGDAPVQAYIAALPGWKRDLAKRLDALVVRHVPGVWKAVKWNSPFYGIEGRGWFLAIHAFTRYLKLTFFRGASLRPMPPGASKDENTRYLDIHDGDESDEARLATWLKQAAALPGWMPGRPSEPVDAAVPPDRASQERANGEAASRLIDQRIRELGGWRGETLARMRALILEADPGMTEEWKWKGTPVWSHHGNVCTGEAYAKVVKLTFARGAALPDPSRLFNASLDGGTRRAIDIREGEQVDARAFKALVKAAVALNGKPVKKRG